MPPRRHYRGPPPTRQEIFDVAHRTVEVLKRCGFRCCLFGSAACAAYGTSRDPHDVDMIVLVRPELVSAEDVKKMIVEEDSNFFLKNSVHPGAAYKVLWYNLPYSRNKRKCKVDILIPKTELKIPFIPYWELQYTPDGLPLTPLAAFINEIGIFFHGFCKLL